MQALPGWIAKGGAEAALCRGRRIGIALKAEDGNSPRARARLRPRFSPGSTSTSDLAVVPWRTAGRNVGEIRPSRAFKNRSLLFPRPL
jgi:hypothetical protein